MKLWQEYLRPTSIAEALRLLNSQPGPRCIIAGGTDLMLDIQQGRHEKVHSLVDITNIPELNQLEIQQKELFIGSAVTLNKIADSPLVKWNAQALTESCSLIGGPQVRNVATLGGNVAHALPAADGTIAMMCLDTQTLVVSKNGFQRIPLHELFLGVGKTALKINQELIAGFFIPLRTRHQASAFKRIMNMQGIALPIINLAVWLEREGDLVRDIRISTGPAGGTPRRIIDIENLLRGGKIDNCIYSEAFSVLEAQIPYRTSPQRATAEYRHQLIKTLLVDTLSVAWNRAS